MCHNPQPFLLLTEGPLVPLDMVAGFGWSKVLEPPVAGECYFTKPMILRYQAINSPVFAPPATAPSAPLEVWLATAGPVIATLGTGYTEVDEGCGSADPSRLLPQTACFRCP